MLSMIESQPISQVRWVHRDLLSPNNYNPNCIAPPELALLKLSILEDGWLVPIITLPEYSGKFQIVDGFHRWLISSEPQVFALTEGMLPTVQISLDPIHRQMSTIRINRAKGSHRIIKMAEIIRQMIEDGVTEKELMKRLGMESEEVKRLNNRAGMPDQIKADGFNKAWIPKRATP